MNIKTALLGALAIAAVSAGAASAQQAIGEDSAWKFRSPNETAVLQNNSNMIQLQKSGYYDLMKNGALGLGGGAGAGGLMGAGASNTQNYFQVINQTTNNCTGGSAVGASLTCGGGANTVTGNSQVSDGNTNTASNTITGNTVTNRDNQSTVQTGTGATTNNTNNQPAPTGN